MPSMEDIKAWSQRRIAEEFPLYVMPEKEREYILSSATRLMMEAYNYGFSQGAGRQ